jgi:hypothetical protein
MHLLIIKYKYLKSSSYSFVIHNSLFLQDLFDPEHQPELCVDPIFFHNVLIHKVKF